MTEVVINSLEELENHFPKVRDPRSVTYTITDKISIRKMISSERYLILVSDLPVEVPKEEILSKLKQIVCSELLLFNSEINVKKQKIDKAMMLLNGCTFS